MLKSKLGKKLAASATALAMVATAAASSISSLTAFAGVQTGEGAFEDGVGLPWHICENGTASMAFAIDRTDGVYSILINNPGGVSNGGVSRWDCQFRHRGLSIHNGHTYRITYSVYSTKPGHLFAKLGDVTNDDCEYWHENGQELSMTYQPHATLAEVESALKSASPGGRNVSYGEGWNNWKDIQITGSGWQTFAWEFTYNSSDITNTTPPDGNGTVEWTFHFGGDGEYSLDGGLFPAGTMLKFDNLMLIDMSCDKSDPPPPVDPEMSNLVTNQLGYFPKLEKYATLQVDSESTAPVDFKVVSSSGETVLTGTGSATKKDEGSWEYCQKLDFSKLTEPGTYHIEADGKKSADFKIGNDIYGDMLGDALNYYYLNRSGVDIQATYVRNGGQNSDKSVLARKAGHSPDKAYITDEWVPQYTEQTNSEIESRYSSKGTKDVSGGWYDAGDYGKYVVNGGVSMWTLANIYERTMVFGNKDKFADGSGVANIPESGNGVPDILDELCWEAEFFLNMQRDDGMVYHKMHDYKWTGLGVMPYDDTDVPDTNFPTRIIKPVTYAATLNVAASLGQLSRLLEDTNSSKASEYLAAAEKAYAAAKTKYVAAYGDVNKAATDATTNDLFAPLDQNKGGGPYGDTQVTDEFYWAACELYITTGKEEYYTDLKKYNNSSDDKAFGVTTNLVGGENQGSPTSFTWGTLAALGTASLALNPDCVTKEEYKEIENNFQKAGDTYLKYESESMYGTPYPGHTYTTTVTDFIGDTTSERQVELTGGYEWGSNSMVINNAMILGMAYDLTKDVKYLNGVTSAMDYILGRNAMENSYVTGYGSSTTKNPHHRYWCHELKNDWPYAPNGCLSGGPNSDMNDPMIQGAGYQIGQLAPMKCYYDQVDAWSVNEITINWNAPLVWVASFVEDEVLKLEDVTPTDPTDSTKDPGNKVYGDANEDGKVSLADVVLVNKHLMAGEPITAQGYENADVDDSGETDEVDALNILKYIIKLVTFPVQ